MEKEQIKSALQELLKMPHEQALAKINGMQAPETDKNILLKAYGRVYEKKAAVLEQQKAAPAPGTIRITKSESYELDHFGAVLVLLAIRLAFSAISAFSGISLGLAGGASPLAGFMTVLAILFIVVLALMLRRKKVFIPLYIIAAIIAIVFNLVTNQYVYAIASLVIEILFITYLFSSKRVALLYQTRPVEIVD